MSAPAIPTELLRAALEAEPARPAVTYYDEASGERVELSVATLDNWVAKTANLLQDGLAVEPGARVVLRLPLHWLAPVWLLACWAAGVVTAPVRAADSGADAGTPADAEVVVVGASDGRKVPAAPGTGAQVVAVSLRPLGAPFAEPLPAGVVDYAREVASYGDRFTPYQPPAPDAPALDLAGRTWRQAELTGVDGLGLGRADRVLSTVPYDTWPAVHAGLLAPLRAGAGVVLVRRPGGTADDDRLARRVAEERVTASVEPVVAGVRALLAPRASG